MSDSTLHKRTDLVLELLRELKDTRSYLKQASTELDTCSEKYLNNFLEDNIHAVQADIDRYNDNLKKINDLSSDITTNINAWYDFVKNPNEIGSIFFPVKFLFSRRKLKKQISSAGKKISEISIENRFIKEDITSWTQELELKAIQQFKQANDFIEFECALNKKDALISELKYLLASIHGFHKIELDLTDIDSFIDEFSKMDAA